MENQNIPPKLDTEMEVNLNSPVQVDSKMVKAEPPLDVNGQAEDTGCGEAGPVSESAMAFAANRDGMIIPIEGPDISGDSCSDQPTVRNVPLFTAALQARIFTVVLMNGIGILAMICEVHIFYRDLVWNKVLDGTATVEFPTKNLTYERRFIAFDQDETPVPGYAKEKGLYLTKFLRRDLVLPMISMVIVLLLLILNVVSQTLDMKNRHRYLSWAAGIYAFLGASLLTAGTIQTVLAQEYITNAYGAARRTLMDHMQLNAYLVPDELPEGDPIFVRANAEYFYQVFGSCQKGNTNAWVQRNEMMMRYFKVPPFRQLVQIGFCVNNKLVVITMITLALLTGLSWVHVFLCLKTWRKHVVERTLAKVVAAEKERKRREYSGKEFRREFAMFKEPKESA